MEVNLMTIIITTLVGCFAIYLAYCIAVKQEFKLIRTINEGTIRRMKNKEKVGKDFGTIFLIGGIYIILCPIIISISENSFLIYALIGFILVMVEIIMELSVEGKIRKGKY